MLFGNLPGDKEPASPLERNWVIIIIEKKTISELIWASLSKWGQVPKYMTGKWDLNSYANNPNLPKNACALSLSYKKKLKGTWKWAII